MKINRVAIVSKFGSEETESTARKVTKKFLAGRSEVFTIAPVTVEGAKKVESVEDLNDKRLDLAVTLGGDGTTLRTFRSLTNEIPILTINVGGNRGILSEITLDRIDTAIADIKANKVWFDKRTRVTASVDGEEFPAALNEIYINRQNLTKTADFEIKFQNDIVKHKISSAS